MTMKEPPYNYTLLRDLPDSGRVYVYGVVRSISDTEFSGPLIEIQDEYTSIFVKVSKESSKYFANLLVNDILRLHRAQIGNHRNDLALLVDVNKLGCHVVSWRGESTTPHIATSKTYTLTDSDLIRLSNLRKLTQAGDPTEVPSTSVNEISTATPDQLQKTPANEIPAVKVDKNKITPSSKRRPVENIANAMEIPMLGSRFFNWYAQVLGVYKGKGEPFTVFIRAWDGTKPSFPAYRNMFQANSSSIDVTYCEIPQTLYYAVEAYTIDVCCYGDWAKKATQLKVKDVIHLCNVRNYTSQSNQYSAVTLHEGGLQFDRALDVLDESNPKHFDISKQCADALSSNFGTSSALPSSSSSVELTPLISKNVVAHSTPVLSSDEHMDVVPQEKLCYQKDFSGTSDFSPELSLQDVANVMPANEQLLHNQVKELASDTSLTSMPPPKTFGGTLTEVNTDSSIIEESPDVTVHFDVRKSPCSTAEMCRSSPSPKRRRPNNNTIVGEKDANQPIEDSLESPEFQPSTSNQISQTPPICEVLSPEQRRSVSTTTGVWSTPQKSAFIRQKNRTAKFAEPNAEPNSEERMYDATSDACEVDFLAVLQQDDELKDELYQRSEDFVEEIKRLFLKSELLKKVDEIRRPEVFQYSLSDEVEKLLTMDVGDDVYFVNLAEAKVDMLEETDYLQFSVIFTAKCVVCGYESVVERSSKTRCRKCFLEREVLSDVVYSYRVTVPVEYKRRDGTPALLLLEIDRKVWDAVSDNRDLFSIDHVMDFYLEKDLRKFVTALNDKIRFAQVVLKERKLLVHHAKIYHINQTDGTLTLFVE